MAEEILDTGTADESTQTDDPFAGTPLEGYDDLDEGQTGDTLFGDGEGATEEEGATSGDEALIPFDQLPPEMKPHVARLTKLHQQKMAEIRESQGKIDAYDRFMTDREYQRQFLQQAAQQLGMELRPAEGSRQQSTRQSNKSGSSDALALAQEALSDEPQELQFLAPLIAKVADAISSKRLEPFEQQQKQSQVHQREAEFDQMVADLTEHAPGWEEHEDEMANLWTFFERAANGGPRVHPKYGNVLNMMYRLITGDRAATAEAGRRMRQALRGRDTTSRGSQAQRPDVRSLIANAEDSDSKWDIAFNDAVKRHARR